MYFERKYIILLRNYWLTIPKTHLHAPQNSHTAFKLTTSL